MVRPQAHIPAPLVRRLPEGGAGGNEGKTQGGLPLGNPVCLWQTELFKLNLKSSPSSSGYNRRRRLATRSSGKQQAERTAVRAAPIACPEESPQCARRRIPLPPAGIDAPTPARGQGLQPYGALYCFGWRTVGGAGGRAESPCFFAGIFISRWFFRQLRPEGFQRGTEGSEYPVDTTAEGG